MPNIPPALRTGLLTLFVLLLIIYYGKTHFYRDPGSIFYDVNRAFERRYSWHRETESKNYIDTVAGNSSVSSRAGDNPSVCAAFSSVKRDSVQYIEAAIGSLLADLTPIERSDLYLTVLFANTNAAEHPTWNKEWLERIVDDVYTYDVEPDTLARLQNLEQTSNYAEKGVFDYVYALKRCLDVHTPYILMLEDDILFARGWFVRTLLGLQEIKDTASRPWLYMRLFNQERSIGWASRDIGGNNEHWIVLGVASAILGAALLARRWRRGSASRLDFGTLLVVALFTTPSLVILFFQCGKASLLPPSPGVYEEGFGCCSQALVFPREQVASLVEFLEEKREGQVDLLINDSASDEEEEKDLARYALYPVQLQHMGTQSVRDTEVQEAQAVWSMAFEDLDSNSLREEHLAMVSQYYDT